MFLYVAVWEHNTFFSIQTILFPVLTCLLLRYIIAAGLGGLFQQFYEYGGDHMPKLKQSEYEMKVRLFQATVAKQLIV